MRDANPLKTLVTLLREAGATVTFSPNCCSGIVSILKDGSLCQCWRCRKERGEYSDPQTEEIAAELSQRAQRAFRESVAKCVLSNEVKS